MKLAEANALTAAVCSWAIRREDIRAMAMVGSWARGNPGPASDLDLLLLSDLAYDYRRRSTWSTFRTQASGFGLARAQSMGSFGHGTCTCCRVQRLN
jgi:hypothetical protein